MSAYVVHHDHINLLVDAAARPRHHAGPMHWYHDGVSWRFGWGSDHEMPTYEMTAQQVGQMLLAENYRSVWYRYPDCLDNDDATPGTAGQRWANYEYAPINWGYLQACGGEFDPITVLKAIDCYEYQSCETPEWPGSMAFAFCDALRRRMIACLPGYDDSPGWGFTIADASRLREVS